MPGNRHDSIEVPPLIDNIELGGLIAGKVFDSNVLVADLNERGVKVVVSQHSARALKPKIDREI